jgi:catechol 2,3-dioxygenase-like lactoylglutathione lyase family enzyme
MKIEHLCLNVQNIEKEKNFYCAVFGFEANANTTMPKPAGKITSYPRAGEELASNFFRTRRCPLKKSTATPPASSIFL